MLYYINNIRFRNDFYIIEIIQGEQDGKSKPQLPHKSFR